MAAEKRILPLLLMLLLLVSGKAEAQDENNTLETPTNETKPSETPKVQREERPGSRAGSLSACPCDLHPGFCDLDCCCDSSCGSGCNVGSPECPFSFCLPGSTRAVSHVCLEKSVIFRNNTPYHTDILPGPGGCVFLFCVQLNDPKLNYLQQPQVVTKVNFPALSAQYGGPSFILSKEVQSSPPAFYRVGDPIHTYFAASSVLSVLKQPMGIGVNQLCIDENPAGFLESKSTSCIRILTDLTNSCTTDPALDAASYYLDFSVLKVPVNMTIFQPLQVSIIPVSEPASPSLNGSTCHNVVSEVIYAVEFNGIHGIQKVSVQFKVDTISGNPRSTLQQRFSLHFWITILQNQGDGQCSATERYKIRFRENVRTGCQFSVPFKLKEANCSHLQQTLYQVFQGTRSPGSLAITGNADPSHPGEWNSIFTQRCNMQDGHCMVPISLEIQVIWARVGLLSNPQAQILGARYHYLCKSLKSLDSVVNMLSLTTAAAFTDVTKWPEPPRGQPRVYWKFPFDFFFPFKMASSGTVSSSGSLPGTLLVTLTLCGLLVL
ncbi:tectonic-3 isoform X2 [Rhineura floridana]|uniref:tectonic-3 isoform X2 n=1 Tax=Rhineura floridana TaxID=261503 RepID=UPI002AC80484|nr:tectonic-3 isoform X2 [Rhineura floridana]